MKSDKLVPEKWLCLSLLNTESFEDITAAIQIENNDSH